ncbi:DUF6318 family protein [Knoellia remsis]|nr:DUF6318 family protein [Knoellia remsis]
MTSSPTGSATGSASASPTPSPTGTFTVPRAATQNTDEGAKAFAKWVVEEADRAYVNVDSSVFQALGEPGCKGCEVTIKAIEKNRAAGHRQVAPSITVDDVGINPSQGGDEVRATAYVSQKAVDSVDATGKVVGRTPVDKFKVEASLIWKEGTWRIANLLIGS